MKTVVDHSIHYLKPVKH